MHERKALQQKTLAQQLDDHLSERRLLRSGRRLMRAACRTKYSGTLRKGAANERRLGGAQPRRHGSTNVRCEKAASAHDMYDRRVSG